MIMLFWQLYIAFACANLCGSMYIFSNDNTGELVETVGQLPAEAYNHVPAWLIFILMILVSLCWPLSYINNLINRKQYKEINKRIEKSDYCKRLKYNSKVICWSTFLIEMVIIFVIRNME